VKTAGEQPLVHLQCDRRAFDEEIRPFRHEAIEIIVSGHHGSDAESRDPSLPCNCCANHVSWRQIRPDRAHPARVPSHCDDLGSQT
jgi:hypothetical protein